jgi:hypothetical protein
VELKLKSGIFILVKSTNRWWKLAACCVVLSDDEFLQLKAVKSLLIGNVVASGAVLL